MERGYIKIEEYQDNSRDKFLCLTDKGRYFMDETLHIKRNIEEEIIKSIGREKFDMMKDIFSSSWFD